MSVLAISIPVTRTRKKAVETAEAVETTRASKDDEASKSGKNLRSNLAQVLYI